MKKYRVMYRPSPNANDASARTEEVWADGWRVDYEKVIWFQQDSEGASSVLDLPKAQVMRIQELRP